MRATELIFGIFVLILVLGVPAMLIILLIYHGETSRRAERTSSPFFGRGFEVKQATSEMTVSRKEEAIAEEHREQDVIR